MINRDTLLSVQHLAKKVQQQLEIIVMLAASPIDRPTETAEAVSLARYRLEQIAKLLGCEQPKKEASDVNS